MMSNDGIDEIYNGYGPWRITNYQAMAQILNKLLPSHQWDELS